MESPPLAEQAGDGIVGRRLPDLLKLRRVNFLRIATRLAHIDGPHGSHLSVRHCLDKDKLHRILELESVVEPAGEKKGVHTGVPLMMIADGQERLLPFLVTENGAVVCRVEMFKQIAARCIVIDSAEVERVLRRELLFEMQAEFRFLQIIVFPLARVAAVECFECIFARSEGSKLSALFAPRAPTEVLCR